MKKGEISPVIWLVMTAILALVAILFAIGGGKAGLAYVIGKIIDSISFARFG